MNDFEGGHNYRRHTDPVDGLEHLERLADHAEREYFGLPHAQRLTDASGVELFMRTVAIEDFGVAIHEIPELCARAMHVARERTGWQR